jgi:hypothetical protein
MTLRCSLSSLTARDLLLIPGLFAHPPPLKPVTSGTTETRRDCPDPQVHPAVSVGLGVAVDGPELPTTPALRNISTRHAETRGTRHSDLTDLTTTPADSLLVSPKNAPVSRQTTRYTATRHAVFHPTALGHPSSSFFAT